MKKIRIFTTLVFSLMVTNIYAVDNCYEGCARSQQASYVTAQNNYENGSTDCYTSLDAILLMEEAYYGQPTTEAQEGLYNCLDENADAFDTAAQNIAVNYEICNGYCNATTQP